MRESIKASCILIFFVTLVTAIVMWCVDRPSQSEWITRYITTFLAVVSLLIFLKMRGRADLVPDYLRAIVGDYFNRGGFCFAFSMDVKDGVCFMRAYFQNQFDQPCHGQIALRPARGFWMTRSKIETIVFDISCGMGAFGVASLPIALQPELFGKKQSFEVGASVEYAPGKRRQLRFFDGICLRSNSNFKNQFHTTLQAAGILTGTIVLTRPATVTVQLPLEASKSVPNHIQPELKILWTLGDPPLATVN